jgi:hypothetical protein
VGSRDLMNCPIRKPDTCSPSGILGALFSVAVDLCDSPASSYEPIYPRQLFIIRQIKLRILLLSIPAVLIKNYYYFAKLNVGPNEVVFLCYETCNLLMLEGLSTKAFTIHKFIHKEVTL